MGQLISSKITDAIKGLFSGLDATDQTLLLDTIIRKQPSTALTDGGTAGTAAGETVLWENQTATNYRVLGVKVTAPVAVTADPTNNAVFNCFQRVAGGGSQLTVATNTTTAGGTGSLVAFVSVALPLTAANLIIAPGSKLTTSITKGGTGVAVASATAQVRVEVVLQPID